MSWIKKEQPTAFDANPPEGFFYLDGDVLAVLARAQWVKGDKLAMLAFPSGEECQIWAGSQHHTIHIFGEMDLRLTGDDRDSAFQHANDIAEQCGYLALKQGENQLEVIGNDTDDHVIITYDNQQKRMTNIQRPTPEKQQTAPAPELLPDDIRQKLPPLYSQEHVGLDAKAQVKFFTPDANWTWYASEFDGQDLFFGLVDGLELELGVFSLAELKQIRGGLGLPVERDLYFEPQSLADILKARRRLRGED